MSNLDKYKEELKRLHDTGSLLLDDFTKNKDKATRFNQGYQSWYSETLEVVRQILPSRLSEFIELYSGTARKIISGHTFTIQDWLLGIRATEDWQGIKKFDDFAAAAMRFQSQLAILASANARFTSSLFDIKQIVQADLFDSELDVANELNKNGYERAAGAVAGVVLEAHLLQVCENHKIKVTKKSPGINDLAQLLKDNEVIEVPEWRKIQQLADLRNLCDHKKKSDPTKEQIDELIDGTKKITKTLF